MDNTRYPDIFNDLKAEVLSTGLLDRVPIRGTVEMIAILLSTVFVFYIASQWDLLAPYSP